MKLLPRMEPSRWSKMERVLEPTMCEMPCRCRKSWTLTARRMMLAMSVMTVEMRTLAPKRLRVSPCERMTGKTMPTECEAKREA